MDRLTELGSTLSNLTMYDIKSMYNQAKNVVLNVSEMEAKVREATNDDPWGASSTLMSDIAQGTFNFQNFNEIMPCIYSQFMEKEARQWRQIYKALQLLEYLVKHGSERVVDDARSHISTLKMLRSFHYIDDKGKDQGINVRNRSREIVDLLSDVEKIRTERRKAKANKSKYTGTGNDGLNFSSEGGRYGGFGGDSLGSGSWSSYDAGGGGYGSRASGYDREYNGSSSGFRDDTSRAKFEEYDAGDDEGPRRSNSTSVPVSTSSSSRQSTARSSTQPAPVQKAPAQPAKIVDLLGFEDETPAVNVASSMATNKALPDVASPPSAFDDEFDDFVGAPVSPTTATLPATVTATSPAPALSSASAKPNLMDLLNQTATPPASGPSLHQSRPSFGQSSSGSFGIMAPSGAQAPYNPSQPVLGSYATSPPPMGTAPMFGQASLQPTRSNAGASTPPATSAAKPSGGFDDLWKSSLGVSSKTAVSTGTAKSIKDLTQEKAQSGLWGSQQQAKHPTINAAALGSFATSTSSSTPASGGDDLLL